MKDIVGCNVGGHTTKQIYEPSHGVNVREKDAAVTMQFVLKLGMGASPEGRIAWR